MNWGRGAAILAIGFSLLASAVLAQPATSAEGWLKPHCQSGSAALGNRPGLIGFSVSCHRGKGRFFRFVVARGDRLGNHVTISEFLIRPRLSGPGAAASHGFCQRLRQEIACRGRGEGKVQLQGWIEVPPVNQCKSNVYLVQVVPRACDANVEDICPFDLRMDWLFKSAPRGC
jgi:hypothetical protein